MAPAIAAPTTITAPPGAASEFGNSSITTLAEVDAAAPKIVIGHTWGTLRVRTIEGTRCRIGSTATVCIIRRATSATVPDVLEVNPGAAGMGRSRTNWRRTPRCPFTRSQFRREVLVPHVGLRRVLVVLEPQFDRAIGGVVVPRVVDRVRMGRERVV